MDGMTERVVNDDQLFKLTMLKLAIILCRNSNVQSDRDMIYKAEYFCRQNFGVPCSEIDSTDPDVVKRIQEWLANAPTNSSS
jgi:hypothetical protein